jgi:hypothetical protein
VTATDLGLAVADPPDIAHWTGRQDDVLIGAPALARR